jgi:hypothetical protein
MMKFFGSTNWDYRPEPPYPASEFVLIILGVRIF